MYLALFTDAYSKKIMGYKLDTNMRATLVKEALEMALKNRTYNYKGIIHHSDRGIQYCCPEFSEFANKNGFILSTTQQYDPYENAVAERVNGILKQEFNIDKFNKDLPIMKQIIKESIEIYNEKRPHYSNYMLTPNQMHNQNEIKMRTYKTKNSIKNVFDAV